VASAFHKMTPLLLPGNKHSDPRGTLRFNNDFNAANIKRIYTIENKDTSFIRAWQGHAIERRWFSAINGKFEIKLIKIDNWENPAKKTNCTSYILDDVKLDILAVPKGYISSIQALEENAKLMVMSDYTLGEIDDEYRFDLDYFEI